MLGIFAIVIGALGILTRLGGLLSIAVFSAVTTAFEDVEASGFLAEKWLAWSILEYSLGLVLAIVLLVGGIGLVQRRWWSAALAVGWAWAKIFFVVGESILAFYMQRDQIQAAGAGPVGVWAGPMAFFFGVVPILIIGLAFPIICLSVLLLGSSKKEVSTWRGAGSGGRGDTVIR